MKLESLAGEGSSFFALDIPPDVAPLEVVFGVVGVLSRDYGAVVTDADVSPSSGVVTLLLPQHDTTQDPSD